MNKLNIALVTGGYSGELEISMKSAAMIEKNLDQNRYNVFRIVISKNEWLGYYNGLPCSGVDRNDFSIILNNEKVLFDCVFVAIHGTPGEDGKLQGYFDMLKLPYTSCDSFTSALTFNKYFAGMAAETLGVPIARSVFVALGDVIDAEAITAITGLPCFVKPNKGGSSVGVTKAHTHEEMLPAINEAFRYDDEVLIQEALSGREITCGILNHKGDFMVLPLCEIVSKKDFFDYEAKYTPGMADEILPAPISEFLADRCRNLSRRLYKQLNCKGVVRFDYVLNGEEYYFLEVNTVPGLTENSIVPRMAVHMGYRLSDLFGMMIEDAMYWQTQRRYLEGDE